MEDVFVAVIQFTLEVVGQALISAPIAFLLPGAKRGTHPAQLTNRGAITALLLMVGGLCGWASVVLFPHSLLHSAALRMASVVASPLLAGAIAYIIAKARCRYNPLVEPSHQFWYGFAFTITFSVFRFAYAAHEGA